MSGIGDLKGYVRSLTPLPLTVVNSHGHFDHAGETISLLRCGFRRKNISIRWFCVRARQTKALIEEIECSQGLSLPEKLRAPLVSGIFDRYLPLSDGQNFRPGRPHRTGRAAAWCIRRGPSGFFCRRTGFFYRRRHDARYVLFFPESLRFLSIRTH
jgi:hypothetical protein